MTHPLKLVPDNARKRVFFTLLAGTLILFTVFRGLNIPLITSAAPGGMVTFELAGNVKTTADILLSWDERADLFAAFGLGLDYLFMPFYALSIAMATLLTGSRQPSGWFRTLGAITGWGVLAAAVFDAIENYALWKILQGTLAQPLPEIAAVCAQIKFGLILIGLLYAVISGLLHLTKK
jgi:hypothetical protein